MFTPTCLFLALFSYASISTVSALTSATCNAAAYGRPHRESCMSLLYRIEFPLQRYFVPPNLPKPFRENHSAWIHRKTLPNVQINGDCNIALLSIISTYSPWTYTWALTSYADIAKTELYAERGDDDLSIMGGCLGRFGIGGFRQVPGVERLVMVTYQSGSLYERFLFSGAGATHYDAAKQLPDGSIIPFWLAQQPNSSHPLHLPEIENNDTSDTTIS